LAVFSLFVVSRRELAGRASQMALLGLLAGLALGVGSLILLAWGSVWIGWATRFGSLPPELPLPGYAFGNVHDIAILVVLCVPAFLIDASGWRRMVAPIGVLVAIAVVAIDGSRNVLLAGVLAFGTTYGVTLWRSRRQWRMVYVIGAVAVLAAGVAVAGFTGLLARLITPDTLGVRLALWTASVDAWLLDPVFGQGPGTFPWVLQRTDYFSEWTFAPRHPDNVLFQLLAEGGLVGILGGGAAVLAVWAGARFSSPPLPAVWALTFFVACGLLANPTDFGFLIVPAVLWAGLCTARAEARPAHTDGARRRWAGALPAAVAVCGAVVFGIAVSIPIAGMLHERSFGRLEVEYEVVEGDLRIAGRIDAGLGLYHRELASVLSGAGGDLDEARHLLERTIALNPSDTAAHRLLALVAQALGDEQAAVQASETALDQKSTDVVNQLTSAQIHAAQGSMDAASQLVAEAAARAPWVTGALDAEAMGLDITAAEAVNEALALWQMGEPANLEYQFEPMWLVALDGAEASLPAAAAETENAPETARSLFALLECQIPEARQLLESARPQEGGSAWYWIVRLMVETVEGTVSTETEWSVQYLGRQNPAAGSGTAATALYNGLADPWGYGQWPLNLPRRPDLPPTEGAGLSEWIRDPIGAARLSVPARPLARCESPGT
jgi:O-antigen ligase/tetratricopeptide (TPR) repeat protein